MISARAASLNIIRELAQKNLAKFIKLMDKKTEFLISRHNAIRYLANELYKSGFTIEEIAYALDIPIAKAKKIINKKVYKNFLNLLEFIDPVTALKMSEGYSYTITIGRYSIKTLLAIELIKAGWEPKKIAAALNLSERTVGRIKNRLKEGYYE